MNKFGFLVKFGLLKRVKTKSFLIGNIIVGIILILLVNVGSIINLFTGNQKAKEELIYLVNDNAGVLVTDQKLLDHYDDLKASNFIIEIKTRAEIGITNDEEFWATETGKVLIVFSGTDVADLETTIYSKLSNSLTTTVTNKTSTVKQTILETTVTGPIIIAPSIVKNPNAGKGDNDGLIGNISSILTVPIFLIVMMGFAMIGTDIIEEKSSKAIETIISCVPAKVHLMSKIATIALFLLIQALVLVAFMGIGALLGVLLGGSSSGGTAMGVGDIIKEITTIFPNLGLGILFTVLFIVVGTVLYLAIAALLAALAGTNEEYQQFQTPFMFILMAGFYIGLYGSISGSTLLLKITGYIPFLAPMIVPSAYLSGVFSTGEAFLSLGISVAFLVLVLFFISPLYKESILNYDQGRLLKKVGRSFKKAFSKN